MELDSTSADDHFTVDPSPCQHCGRGFDDVASREMHFMRNRCPNYDTRNLREKIHDFLVFTILAWSFANVPGVEAAYEKYRSIRYGY